MAFRRAAVSCVLRAVLGTLCRVDSGGFKETLSKNGPMLVAFNHVNFLEVPMLVAYSHPLKVTGLAKSETWRNPVFAFLFDTYRAIPIERGRAFAGAFRRVREAMDDGFFMCVAPEGRRSGDGVLGEGKPGIIRLAMEADAPILPVAHYGGERIWDNIRRFRRTDFSLRVGRPFRIRFDGSPGREERAEIMAEIMGRMAALLPEHMRGVHAERAGRECRHLEFLP